MLNSEIMDISSCEHDNELSDSKKDGISQLTEWLIASQEELWPVELHRGQHWYKILLVHKSMS
jgi:hypothetical protein